MKKTIQVKGVNIVLFEQKEEDYISLTDIAKSKSDKPDVIIQNWLRNRNTIEFLGLWEKENNPNFKPLEFEGFKKEAGLNSFLLSPKKWIEGTSAIGIISKPGRYGGTYGHKYIAFEFASWISAEFKYYLIKEFDRLKAEENERKLLGWDIKRNLAKINYKIQTDSIKKHLIPSLGEFQKKYIYANEADLLNLIVFGKTAKEWSEANKELAKMGNMRDYADVLELSLLSNLESFNSEFIKGKLDKETRFIQLSEIAKTQRNSMMELYKKKELE